MGIDGVDNHADAIQRSSTSDHRGTRSRLKLPWDG